MMLGEGEGGNGPRAVLGARARRGGGWVWRGRVLACMRLIASAPGARRWDCRGVGDAGLWLREVRVVVDRNCFMKARVKALRRLRVALYTVGSNPDLGPAVACDGLPAWRAMDCLRGLCSSVIAGALTDSTVADLCLFVGVLIAAGLPDVLCVFMQSRHAMTVHEAGTWLSHTSPFSCVRACRCHFQSGWFLVSRCRHHLSLPFALLPFSVSVSAWCVTNMAAVAGDDAHVAALFSTTPMLTWLLDSESEALAEQVRAKRLGWRWGWRVCVCVIDTCGGVVCSGV